MTSISERPKKVGFIVYPGFSVMSLAASTVFEIANLVVGKPVYDIQILSEDGGMVVGSSAMTMQTQALSRARYDTLIVGAGSDLPHGSPALLSYLRAAPKRVRRVASICTGAFILAQAGLSLRTTAEIGQL